MKRRLVFLLLIIIAADVYADPGAECGSIEVEANYETSCDFVLRSLYDIETGGADSNKNEVKDVSTNDVSMLQFAQNVFDGVYKPDDANVPFYPFYKAPNGNETLKTQVCTSLSSLSGMSTRCCRILKAICQQNTLQILPIQPSQVNRQTRVEQFVSDFLNNVFGGVKNALNNPT